MEVIKKIVNLRDFAEKFGENETCINKPSECNCSSYGYFPYDIKVMGNSPFLIQNMPAYINESGDTGVKYGTFANYYTWIRRFIMESKYYTPKKRGETEYWAETGNTLNYHDFNDTVSGVGKYDLFSESEGVFEELPKNISDFECGETIICVNLSADTFEKVYSGITCACDFIEFAESSVFSGLTKEEVLEPFIELNLFINEEIDEMGAEYIYRPEEYDETKAEEYREGDYVIISGNTYCLSGGTWVKLVCSGGTSDTGKTYFTESKLRTLLREKTTSDDSGNTLNFVYNSSGGVCELRYLVGSPCNAAYNEKITAYTYDIISNIVCHTENADIDYSDYNDISEFSKAVISGGTGRIVFTYVIGNLLGTSSGDIYTSDYGGGITYEDSYDYDIKEEVFTINSKRKTFVYVGIDYTTSEKPDEPIKDVIYSKIRIKRADEEMLDFNVLLRYDYVFGIEDTRFKTEEINIDRGSSSSYEAFNVLGEVNTLDDVEKYHNDWFRIGGKND